MLYDEAKHGGKVKMFKAEERATLLLEYNHHHQQQQQDHHHQEKHRCCSAVLKAHCTNAVYIKRDLPGSTFTL